jgi:cytosine deaminase
VNSLIIRNARIRSQPQPVDIAIDGARISAVGPKLAVETAREIDAAGSLVLP